MGGSENYIAPIASFKITRATGYEIAPIQFKQKRGRIVRPCLRGMRTIRGGFKQLR